MLVHQRVLHKWGLKHGISKRLMKSQDFVGAKRSPDVTWIHRGTASHHSKYSNNYPLVNLYITMENHHF